MVIAITIVLALASSARARGCQVRVVSAVNLTGPVPETAGGKLVEKWHFSGREVDTIVSTRPPVPLG
jgi:hypothetical protein